MGVVKLHAKNDYFPGNSSDVLPNHPVKQLNKTRFEYLWRCFHASYKSGELDTKLLVMTVKKMATALFRKTMVKKKSVMKMIPPKSTIEKRRNRNGILPLRSSCRM
jgi:hypothetical protein